MQNTDKSSVVGVANYNCMKYGAYGAINYYYQSVQFFYICESFKNFIRFCLRTFVSECNSCLYWGI